MNTRLGWVALLSLLSACRSALPVPDGSGGQGGEGGEAPNATGGTASGGAATSGGATASGSASASGGRTASGGTAGGGSSSGGTDMGGGAGASSLDNCGAPGVCDLVECAPEKESGLHVAVCSELSPKTNPPTSGPHYPVWAQFGIYEKPIPDGFFIHSLEHSSVALLYDCEAAEEAGLDCTELRQELIDFYDGWARDALCTDIPHRLIVAPRSGLGAPFAAAAWGYYLKGNCFDSARVGEFVSAHYGMNYENICGSGVDPFAQGCTTN